MTEAVATERNGTYVDTGGIRTYYEVSGAGEPLVLLHGGLCTAETWDAQTTALAEHFRVYVPERVGHGRTPDVDGPITYENMAQHTIDFMEAVGIEPAFVAGWSDGAMVGLLVALRRPTLVRKLVFIEMFVTLAGAQPGYHELMAGFTAEAAPRFLVDLYAAVSPDGRDHFPVVFEKLHQMWAAPTGVEVFDLRNVSVPTLLLLADDGTNAADHTAAVHRAIPDCQLAIVPGTSHGLPLEKPHVVNLLISDFLADQQVPKVFANDDL